ncbi:hypothetical protein CBA19CS11_30550 [Caballeronia novacaledonica]|uniref:hypothetical protein n=1 Tax=Caballeronia novacaledonica TaxID=1544861 RepID=UPI001EE28D31|nr:hypothetical protein [Caballeronia novacaledonica]GJH13270.1 hypothetical protein CBA19CS11_30550 [Caballeronia novacaledonica]
MNEQVRRLTPNKSETTLGMRMMWFVILWLAGFAGTILLALPFHILVAASMHR